MDMKRGNQRGVYLQQYKEPALSREIRQFLNTSTEGFIDRPVDKPLSEMTAQEIIDVAEQAGIVDERDGRLLCKKLNRAAAKGVKTVVVDALDDEPYVSSQLGPLLHCREEVLAGLQAAVRAVGAEHCSIAVYKNISDTEIRIPSAIEGVKVVRIGGKYPAEAHIGREMGLTEPFVTIGACALIFLCRALTMGSQQKTAFITVAGNCIANPTNLEVSLGMNLSQVLERCGLADNPTRVVIGGSMTGISVIDTEKTLISPTTRAVLAFREDEREKDYNCIGCGRCINACPQGLDPMSVYRAFKSRRYSLLAEQHMEDCINCGTCSYVCPSRLPLSAVISRFRKNVNEEED